MNEGKEKKAKEKKKRIYEGRKDIKGWLEIKRESESEKN